MPVLRKILFKLSFSSNSLMSLHMLSVEFQPHLCAVGQPALVGSSRTPFVSVCQSPSPLWGGGHMEHCAPQEEPPEKGWLGFWGCISLSWNRCNGWSDPSFTMGDAESLRAGPVGHDFGVVMAVLRALCLYSTECRKGLTHGTSLPIPCLPGWRLCHCPPEVGM